MSVCGAKMPKELLCEESYPHAGRHFAQFNEEDQDLKDPRPTTWEGAMKEINQLKQEREDQEKATALHADLNRRTAAALGKPTVGPGSSWHDIPEKVAQLKRLLAEEENDSRVLSRMLEDTLARLMDIKERTARA